MSQLLSEQASQQLVNSIVDIAEKIALEKVKQSRKRYLIQKEVMEEYNVTHKVITEWEIMGLRKVKIGKTIRYDRQDIENVIEQMKIETPATRENSNLSGGKTMKLYLVYVTLTSFLTILLLAISNMYVAFSVYGMMVTYGFNLTGGLENE